MHCVATLKVPFAAALAVLPLAAAAAASTAKCGVLLRTGLQAQAVKHGFEADFKQYVTCP
jgi:hypothetical protein